MFASQLGMKKLTPHKQTESPCLMKASSVAGEAAGCWKQVFPICGMSNRQKGLCLEGHENPLQLRPIIELFVRWYIWTTSNEQMMRANHLSFGQEASLTEKGSCGTAFANC